MQAKSDWVPVQNTTTEVIPPGALMRVVEVDSETGSFKVAKPAAASDVSVLVNGLTAIPATAGGVTGEGQGTWEARSLIAYDPADGEPAVGQSWGTVAGSWLARTERKGFTISGGAGMGLVNVVRFQTAAAACCPDSPPPETTPLECPGSGSGSGGTDVGTICAIGHSEPGCCKFLMTSKCAPDNPPNYTLTSLCSGTTITPTQMQCIIDNTTCTVTSITWKACIFTGGPGPCAEVKSAVRYCVKVANGTGSYGVVAGSGASVVSTLSLAGFGFAIATPDGTFSISGSLVWCCKNGVTGLYFRGKINSQNPDPDHLLQFPCGCVIDITDACNSGGVQSLTAGPSSSGGVFSGETLHITTDCGELDIIVSPAPCDTGECYACPLAGLTPTMVIPDGPAAGTYPATGPWTAGAGPGYTTNFNGIPGHIDPGAAVVCYGPGPNPFNNQLFLSDNNPYTGSETGTSACGSPTVMTFPGALFGSTGDIVIST